MSTQPTDMTSLRQRLDAAHVQDEASALRELLDAADFDPAIRERISARAVDLVTRIRGAEDPGLMEVFLAEYGLSTTEGVALMCLAEALLRVPDSETIDALIEDKIAPSAWGAHLGKSSSSLVNASTWGLLLTGKVLRDEDESGLIGALHGVVKRLGEPVIRVAVGRAMRELGSQFVLGRTIEEAMSRAAPLEATGYSYSYDMLGEAARTEADARRYHLAYSEAIGELAKACDADNIRANPGISIKLSALHPRYEVAQRQRVMEELVPRTRSLALLAKSGGMGLNIDAEEADRLSLSLDVIEAVVSDPSLAGWDGFGVVVQAYGQRATHVIDWLYALSAKLDRRLMVRLVKGAYWDTEVKLAQTEGLDGYPVYTRKVNTDVSYLCCAKKLLGMTDRLYPQFATHNAHTVSAIMEMSDDPRAFEFQRLHGMGESLHQQVLAESGTRCRIYAPVGAHRDLLAYLVRRLLENGANSSFVNQIVDTDIPPEEVAADPVAEFLALEGVAANPGIPAPDALYAPSRINSKGFDLSDAPTLAAIDAARKRFSDAVWEAGPMLTDADHRERSTLEVRNPAQRDELVGRVALADAEDVETAMAAAAVTEWSSWSASDRAAALRRASDLYERDYGELFALLAREAGKTLLDCVGELREAVDFLRYYAAEAEAHAGGEVSTAPRGVISCISPWNFPLAIFTGQLSAALVAGNAVVAKPAESTALIAAKAVRLLHEAGVPRDALQLLPGPGRVVGAAICADPRVGGVCFTGSTATAQHINRGMAASLAPAAPLIAETGGLNAMIVDSTALPEQAVRDIVASSFQSAGQRCSALRVLYLQTDIADRVLDMLYGAMDELRLGAPWDLATDVGPVIDVASKARIDAHVEQARLSGRLLKQLDLNASGATADGHFVAPAVIGVGGIGDLEEEIFGPVLHVARFAADEIDAVVDAVNASGYGLTFGLHTRIDDRVQQVVGRVRAGNVYINRNQIGAIVGSQPFGGEGLSGTGPKAGGPHYVPRFYREVPIALDDTATAVAIETTRLNDALLAAQAGSLAPDGTWKHEAPEPTLTLPGPTGESNQLKHYPRGVVLCLGPTADAARAQVEAVRGLGCAAVGVAPGLEAAYGLDGTVSPTQLTDLLPLDGVVCHASEDRCRALRTALAERGGALVPLLQSDDYAGRFLLERHVCIDTTAAGGNASLLAESSG